MKKTNRTFKRFAAITSASLLAACAVMPAVSSAVNITITKGDASIPFDSHTFEAYQIFKGDLDEATNTLTNITWGSNINTDSFIRNLNLNATELGITEINSNASASDVADALAAITEADKAKRLAKIVNDSLKPVADAKPVTSSNGVIANLDVGYYFVKDADNSGTASGDAKTRFILKVTDDETVEIKTDAPSLEKKIKHNETNEWGDVGDNQIGDTVEYYIATTVPDISDYDTYKYIIRDNMEDGLTYSGVTKIEYQPKEGAATPLWDGTGTPENITITAENDPNTDFAEDFYINFDLKELDLAAGGTIYTYYSAVLNEKAEVSSGAADDKHNDNTAYLTYSNNPNQSGSGNNHSTNDTEEDTVYDWTYTFDASKVDGSLADKPALAGAKFSLYEGDSETAMSLVSAGTIDDIDYYRIATAAEIADTSVDKVTVITTSTTEGRTATFRILGLDDAQKYVIKEIETPSAEYNKCPDVVINGLTATYDTVGTDLTALTASITQGTNENANASNSVTIENNKGSVLPGTGGIGTTIFYLGGGAMAAIGGVYLISKRRMKKSEE